MWNSRQRVSERPKYFYAHTLAGVGGWPTLSPGFGEGWGYGCAVRRSVRIARQFTAGYDPHIHAESRRDD